MRAKPPEVDDADLLTVIRNEWLFDAISLTFVPVGAGSHHWVAAGRRGERRFVTVDDLDLKPWLGADFDTVFTALRNGYEIAEALRANGLEFVVAPIAANRGDVLVRLNERFTVALFPWIDGVSGDFDEPPNPDDRDRLLRMWARLHGATPAVRGRAVVRGFTVTCRVELEAAMKETDRAWLGGPLSIAARDWLASNSSRVSAALVRFDRLGSTVSAKHGELVITHGEPHGMNVITSPTGRHLIDWDTVALALPERDLWMLDDRAAGGFDAYVEASGRRVDRDALALYGMAWHLSDIGLFIDLLRGEHRDDADSQKALDGLSGAAARLRRYIPR